MDGGDDDEAAILATLRDGAPELRRFEAPAPALLEMHRALCASHLAKDIIEVGARSLLDSFDAHVNAATLGEIMSAHVVQLRGVGAGVRRAGENAAGAPYVRFELVSTTVGRDDTPARAQLMFRSYAAEVRVSPVFVDGGGAETPGDQAWLLRVPVPVGTALDKHARQPHPRRPRGLFIVAGVIRAIAAQLSMPAPYRLHLRYRPNKRTDVSGFVVCGNVGDEPKLVLRMATMPGAPAAAAAVAPPPVPVLMARVMDSRNNAELPLGALIIHLLAEAGAPSTTDAPAALGSRAAARAAPRGSSARKYAAFVRAAFAHPTNALTLDEVREKWPRPAAAVLPGVATLAKVALLEKWGAEVRRARARARARGQSDASQRSAARQVARAAFATAGAAGTPEGFENRDHDTNMYVATAGRFVRDLIAHVWVDALHGLNARLGRALGAASAVDAAEVLAAVKVAGAELGAFVHDDAPEPGAMQKRIRAGITRAELGRRYKNMPQVVDDLSSANAVAAVNLLVKSGAENQARLYTSRRRRPARADSAAPRRRRRRRPALAR